MDGAMPCSEYLRLRQLYEGALKHFGHILLSTKGNESIGLATQDALKKQAEQDRSVAKQRINFHQQNCAVCRAALREIRHPTRNQ
jgi:hypothetical protein